MYQTLKTLFCTGLCAVILCGCNDDSASENVNVTARKIHVLMGTAQPIRSDVQVDLSIENAGNRPVKYDTIVGEFFLQEDKACQEKKKLDALATIPPGENRNEIIRGNFGLYQEHQVGREVVVYLLLKGQVVYGPFSILVPLDLTMN